MARVSLWKRLQEAPLSLPPGKDSASRWPENPEAGPCRTVNLSAPQSWTSQHPGFRKSHASHSAAQSMVCYSSQQTETPWKHRLGFFFCPWLPTTLQGKQREGKDRLGRKCLRVPSSRETPGSMNGPPSGQETASRIGGPSKCSGKPTSHQPACRPGLWPRLCGCGPTIFLEADNEIMPWYPHWKRKTSILVHVGK